MADQQENTTSTAAADAAAQNQTAAESTDPTKGAAETASVENVSVHPYVLRKHAIGIINEVESELMNMIEGGEHTAEEIVTWIKDKF